MNETSGISRLAHDAWLALHDPSVWLQLAAIVCAGLAAWAIHHYWGAQIDRARRDKTGFKRLTLGTGMRLLFPFTMLLLVLAARALLDQLDEPTDVLATAVPLLLSLAAIRLTIYVLRKAFSPSRALRASENAIGTLIWIVVALHLLGWLPEINKALDGLAFTIGATRVSLLWAIKLVISVGFFLLLALWLSALLEKRLLHFKHLSAGLRVGLAKTARVVFITVGFLVALNAIGFDLTGLAVFGGALGVGLGFGLQRITSNFISGFILLFDRSIRPGDVISIGTSFGWVQELRARYVVVRDRDGVDTLIPNENLITSQVINWSYGDRNVRVKIPVQISYADDPDQAIALMLEAARSSPRALPEPAPVCRLLEFGDNGIQLELRIWINDPEQGINGVRSDINLAIWRAFKAHGITIPFPQRDLHIKDGMAPTGAQP
jgi:small-conductance mechanosensitive channel